MIYFRNESRSNCYCERTFDWCIAMSSTQWNCNQNFSMCPQRRGVYHAGSRFTFLVESSFEIDLILATD